MSFELIFFRISSWRSDKKEIVFSVFISYSILVFSPSLLSAFLANKKSTSLYLVLTFCVFVFLWNFSPIGLLIVSTRCFPHFYRFFMVVNDFFKFRIRQPVWIRLLSFFCWKTYEQSAAKAVALLSFLLPYIRKKSLYPFLNLEKPVKSFGADIHENENSFLWYRWPIFCNK